MAFYKLPPTVFGGARPTPLIYPNAYNPKLSYPLILLLHSYGADRTDVIARFGLTEAHNFDSGCLILAPDGVLDGANKHFPYGSAAGAAAEEAYLIGLVDAVKAVWSVSYTCCWGYSNGGLRADELVAKNPSKFNQLLTLAGSALLTTSASPTGIEVPSVTIHGTADTTVVTAGENPAASLPGSLSTYGGYKSSAQTAADRHARNGGAPEAIGADYGAIDLVTAVVGSETTRKKYPTTRDEFWEIVGGNHAFSFSARRGETVFVHAALNHR